MISTINSAEKLLKEWKREKYQFGSGAIRRLPEMIASGSNIHLVVGKSVKYHGRLEQLVSALKNCGCIITAISDGAGPNSPIEDVIRVANDLIKTNPDMVISFGGGSVIDAVKASIVLTCLGGSVEDYFGTDLVSNTMERTGKKLIPHLAIMTASASAAHLTKYSNITDMGKFQKKIIVDNSIIPDYALFDYDMTVSMSQEFTKTGAFDGIGHLSEVFYGFPAKNKNYLLIENIVETGINLICEGLNRVIKCGDDLQGRNILGLGTDLGGYAIMVGSTNGPHLNSFSLVDVMDHGKAVAIMQPYYGYFFSNSIPGKIRKLCSIYKRSGLLVAQKDLEKIPDSDLGKVYADTLISLAKKSGFPYRLKDIEGFSLEHVEKILEAAKNPQLKSKLEAMPIPFNVTDVNSKMRSIVMAAVDGDYKNIQVN